MLAKVDFLKNIWEAALKSPNLESRDFLDIFIIAFLIFFVIKLLRETHSVSVVAGVFTLLGLYGIAIIFDLSLTNLVLRSVFGAFLIIIAIIFQKELRRFFSSFGFLEIAKSFIPPSEAIIGTVARSVANMARNKIGALIIFPGREPIERHLEGGYRLNGEVSEPLLFSLFDKTSPGHDGATIIEANRVKKFAVHLPLAEQIGKTRQFGLRHRAALGLSERSDALIIVVSEEQGDIKIVQNGKILPIDNEDKLKEKLAYFYAKKFPKRKAVYFSRWLVKNISLLVLSFAAALSIFTLVNSKFVFIQRNFAVTPEFTNIPPEILIKDVIPQEVILTLKARASDFEVFKPDNLRLEIDASIVDNILRPGKHRVPVAAKNVIVPFKFQLVKIEPASVQIQIAKNIVLFPEQPK